MCETLLMDIVNSLQHLLEESSAHAMLDGSMRAEFKELPAFNVLKHHVCDSLLTAVGLAPFN